MLSKAGSPRDSARLLSVLAPESWALLEGPSNWCAGTGMTNSEFCSALRLQLGLTCGNAGVCACGAVLNAKGDHVLSCWTSDSRSWLHSAVYSTFQRAFSRARTLFPRARGLVKRAIGQAPWWHRRRAINWGQAPRVGRNVRSLRCSKQPRKGYCFWFGGCTLGGGRQARQVRKDCRRLRPLSQLVSRRSDNLGRALFISFVAWAAALLASPPTRGPRSTFVAA